MIVKIPCGPLYIILWILFWSIIPEFIGLPVFFTGRPALLIKTLCFQQPLRCNRNDLLTSTVLSRISFVPLQIVPRCLSHSIVREKWAKLFCHREDGLFLKNLVFNFLGPEEMIIYLKQYLSNYILDPYKLLPDTCHVRYYEKKLAKSFSLLERLPVFQNFVFHNLLGPKHMLLVPQCLSN